MGPAEEIQTFDRRRFKRRWYFRIVATGNNEIIAQSEAYNSRTARDKTATRLAYSLGCAVVPGRQR